MLYIVPTPIGNLEDITYRAVKVLNEVDIIFAEDTRKTKTLLRHFDISYEKLRSYHKFNEHKQIESFILDANSKDVALVSDAGTPGISDPGFLLVRECVKHNIDVITLPGATAFIPALVNSGLPCDRFYFEGFLPHKKGRQKRLEILSKKQETIILYESPYRVCKTLEQLVEFMGGDRLCSVSREISKIYEETVRGTLLEVKNYFTEKTPKGEFVVIIQGEK